MEDRDTVKGTAAMNDQEYRDMLVAQHEEWLADNYEHVTGRDF